MSPSLSLILKTASRWVARTQGKQAIATTISLLQIIIIFRRVIAVLSAIALDRNLYPK
ncbi:hypothetical protein [Microcoleus sp. FACHB-831]|uniref:hypothetical protein n=1 Tax=Microcoleus sp. FACHB-831 TaxID=2692827 RepID=UPI001685E6F6|nr:hypothetical protein [Microcoleus sp. FACHB-831]